MTSLDPLVHRKGHAQLYCVSDVILEIERNGGIQAYLTEDISVLNNERLAEYSAIFFNMAIGVHGGPTLDTEQKKSLIDFIKYGGGLIGVHLSSFIRDFPEYVQILGGRLGGHPWIQEVGVIVEDRKNPSTKHLPKTLRFKEEVYVHRDWDRKKTNVLISLDNSSVDLSKGRRKDNDYALSWCHSYGDGRVFYTALGHFREVWETEWFRKHLGNGIIWTMKQIEL